MRRITVLLLLLSIVLSGCTWSSTSQSDSPTSGSEAQQPPHGSDVSQGQEAVAPTSEPDAAAGDGQKQDNISSAPPGDNPDSLPPVEADGPADEATSPVADGERDEQGDQSWEAGEARFLDAVGTAWRGNVPDDSSVLLLGRRACDQIAAGVQIADVNVVEGSGELRNQNNDMSRLAALHLLCPELIRY